MRLPDIPTISGMVTELDRLSIVQDVMGLWKSKQQQTFKGVYGYTVGGNTSVTESGTPLGTTEKYDAVANTWALVKNLTVPLAASAGLSLNGFGYVIGGYFTSTVQKYDSAKDTWTLVKNTKSAKYSLTGFSINGFAYEVGGFYEVPGNGEIVVGTIERYYDVTDTWTQVKKMNVARSRLAGFSIKTPGRGYGFAVAGYTIASGGVGTTEKYDPVFDTWTQEANMPENTWSTTTGFSIGKYGYVTNYSLSQLPTARYDLTTGTWLWVAQQPLPQSAAMEAGTDFTTYQNPDTYGYSAGGYNGDPTVWSGTNKYDPVTNTWSVVGNLNVGRSWLTSFSLTT